MRKPSMKQAEWIHSKLAEDYKETADDVYDVLLGTITSPADFVSQVFYWADEYEDDLRRHNVKNRMDARRASEGRVLP